MYNVLLDWHFPLFIQNGADHSDKVEEPAEEKHKNGDGMIIIWSSTTVYKKGLCLKVFTFLTLSLCCIWFASTMLLPCAALSSKFHVDE